MKKKLTPKWFVIMLTGLLFSAYAAYNVFILIRDVPRGLSSVGILISALVAAMFFLLAGYALTFAVNVKKKRILFVVVRRAMLIIALFVLFALKLRMIDRVIAYLQPPDLYSGVEFNTVLYGVSYFLTLTAMLILLVYCLFIRRRYLLFPKAFVRMPAITLILFLCSFVMDMILLYGYGIPLEASMLRTAVMRPIFYLGFIGLCVYYLLPMFPVSSSLQSDSDEEASSQDSAT